MPISEGTRAFDAAGGSVPVFYNAEDIAKILKISATTARRLFADEDGVFRIANDPSRGKRSYVTMRVPAHVFERVVRRLSK